MNCYFLDVQILYRLRKMIDNIGYEILTRKLFGRKGSAFKSHDAGVCSLEMEMRIKLTEKEGE